MRVEKRRDDSLAVRFRDRYLSISQCDQRPKVTPSKSAKRRRTKPKPGSSWNKNFDLKKSPQIWQVAQSSGPEPEEFL